MQDRNRIRDGYLLTTGSNAKLYAIRDGMMELLTEDPQLAARMWQRMRERDDRKN